jgi:hypothetical protein
VIKKLDELRAQLVDFETIDGTEVVVLRDRAYDIKLMIDEEFPNNA